MTSSDSKRADEIVRCWAELYEKETVEYGKSRSREERLHQGSDCDNDSEAFASIFASLVHSSPALSMTLAQLEHEHAVAVSEKCDHMAAELREADQADPMDLMVLKAKLESDVSHLKETQKREFRDWIVKVSESVRTKNSEIGIAPMSKSDSAFFVMSQAVSSPAPPSGGAVNTNLQESFTITLGAQMKQMHNLRLVAANPIQLCRYDILGAGDNFGHEDDWLPRRLQTAMSLYSHNLSGLVVLTESNLDEDSPRDTTGKVAEICSRSTEYHFPSFDQQLESLKLKTGPGKRLKCGDFYMTRHSNLCEIHVLFHMMSKSCKKKTTSDSGGEGADGEEEEHPPLSSAEKVNSRHPVVMGLRSVLKTASLCGVTTLTIPLLLSMSLTDEMTSVSWCLRRAELVFKCVKGFMMEVASCGGGEDLKTLQFVVPKDIDQDVFNRLTSMLASIFRSSNPIKGS